MSSHCLRRQHSHAICEDSKGNPDLYGLGIRIGIYLQWISSLLIQILVPSSTSDSLDVNSVFLLAVFVAILSATNSSDVQTILGLIGAFVMLQMGFGYLLSVMSITGLRTTFLSNPRGIIPGWYPIGLQRFPYTTDALSSNIREIWKLLSLALEKPPAGVAISQFQLLLLRSVSVLAFVSIYQRLYNGTLVITAWSGLELALWLLDFYVMISMGTPFQLQDDAAERYRQSRLRTYQRIQIITKSTWRTQVFSLRIRSIYKQDEVSCLGVCWRSCMVGGIAIYNPWFWFAGISSLTSCSCEVYIFFLGKFSILGKARIYFKVLSVTYAMYAAALLIASLHVVRAFYQTIIHSLLINLFVMPYAKFLLVLSSVASSKARAFLDGFDDTQI